MMNTNASKLLWFFLILLIHSAVLIERSDFPLSSLFPPSSPSRYNRRVNSEPRLRSLPQFDSEEEIDKFLINKLDRKEHRERSLFDRNDRFLLPHRPRPLFLPFINDPFPVKPVLSYVKQANDKLFIIMEDEAKCTKNTTESENKSSLSNSLESPPVGTKIETDFIKSQPSACIWAIIACCAPTNYHFWHGCFHYLGCSVAFWQVDPCQLSVILMASREAVEYYEQFEVRQSSTISPLPTPPISDNGLTSTTAVLSTSVTEEVTTKTDESTTIITSTVNPTSEEPTTEKPTTDKPATETTT
ncbi:hypothetical protein PGB90_009107 [Kerria lacca]